jgi:MFS family permease
MDATIGGAVLGAVSFNDVVVWLHVTAVVVGFGGTFAYGVLMAFVGRSAPRAMPGLLAALQANDRSLVTIGGAVVLLTGLYLAAVQWGFSPFFVAWGIVAVIVLLGLLHGYFIPNERRAQEAAERDIEAAGGGEVEFGEDFARANRRLAIMGPVAGLIIVLTIYVMVAKPFS